MKYVDDIWPIIRGPAELERYTAEIVAVMFDVNVDMFPSFPYSMKPSGAHSEVFSRYPKPFEHCEQYEALGQTWQFCMHGLQ